jgi:hypothetical protein
MSTPSSTPLIARPAAPSWVAPAFAGFALFLVPWIGYLAVTLPHAARAYERLPWVGFDIGLMTGLAATAILAWRGSVRVAFAATVTATLLVTDAWFDVTTSIRTSDVISALAMSVVELSLAAVCIWIAYHADRVLRTNIRHLLRRNRRSARAATAAASENVAGS